MSKLQSNLYNTIFTGPTKEQRERMKRGEQLQDDYMKFVIENPNLELSVYEAKYAELKAKAGI